VLGRGLGAACSCEDTQDNGIGWLRQVFDILFFHHDMLWKDGAGVERHYAQIAETRLRFNTVTLVRAALRIVGSARIFSIWAVLLWLTLTPKLVTPKASCAASW
jgi:hypothetical protein